MGQTTDFYAQKRELLAQKGERGRKAFWEHNLGFLNKAFWFDQILWEMPDDLNSPEADYELVSSGIHSDYGRPLTVKALEYVIKVLSDLDEKVMAMPCDREKDTATYFYDMEKRDFNIAGSPNGIAMMKEVERVLGYRCKFDFGYPWDRKAPYYEPGTTLLRRVLKGVVDKYNGLNKDGDWILYKTTG